MARYETPDRVDVDDCWIETVGFDDEYPHIMVTLGHEGQRVRIALTVALAQKFGRELKRYAESLMWNMEQAEEAQQELEELAGVA